MKTLLVYIAITQTALLAISAWWLWAFLSM